MKKIIVLILMVGILLVGCKKEEQIAFFEFESADINWKAIEFPIDSQRIQIPENMDSISTNEDAQFVGQTMIEYLWSDGCYLDYVLLSIGHSTSDHIWLFTYSMDQRDKDADELIDCGGLYVAIDGNHCELVKAWVEE